MITPPPAVLSAIASRQFVRADLWALTPIGLPPLYFTSADIAVMAGGIIYQPSGMLMVRGRGKVVLGLETDTLDWTLHPDPAAEGQINGIPLRQAAARGVLDGAAITLTWAYISSWGPPPVVAGTVLRFVGAAGAINVKRDRVDITINSVAKRLDMPVPSRSYGAGCRWTLGDAGCGVNVSALAVSTAAGPGCTNKVISAILPASAPGWAGGRLRLLTGVDTAIERTIQSYTSGCITLATPLPWAPAAGDALIAYPGCDKVHWGSGGVSCAAYGNQGRFGGTPFIPAPETTYGG